MPKSPKNVIARKKARALTKLRREHIHLTLLKEAVRGLEDVADRKTLSLRSLRVRYGR